MLEKAGGKIGILVNSIDPPQQEPNVSDDACWRCRGIGEVMAYDGTMTPCGACLGIEAPKPCPKCRANAAKIFIMLDDYFCWRCRQCGFEGPQHDIGGPEEEDAAALRAWNALPREDADGDTEIHTS